MKHSSSVKLSVHSFIKITILHNPITPLFTRRMLAGKGGASEISENICPTQDQNMIYWYLILWMAVKVGEVRVSKWCCRAGSPVWPRSEIATTTRKCSECHVNDGKRTQPMLYSYCIVRNNSKFLFPPYAVSPSVQPVKYEVFEEIVWKE